MLMESLSELNQDKIFGYLKSDDLIYKLDQISNIIGRDTESTIVLNHPSISKKHAKIDYDTNANTAFLIDLNSTHGTFINDKKLSPNQSIQLKSGDILSFGQSEVKYIYLPNYNLKDLLSSNNNNFDYKIRDNKISLVNENEYESASINHFNGLNSKLNSFNPNNLNIDNNINNEDEDKHKNLDENINNINEDENIEEEIKSQDNFKFWNNQNQMTQINEESNPEMQSNTLMLSSNNYIQQKVPNNINKSKNINDNSFVLIEKNNDNLYSTINNAFYKKNNSTISYSSENLFNNNKQSNKHPSSLYSHSQLMNDLLFNNINYENNSFNKYKLERNSFEINKSNNNTSSNKIINSISHTLEDKNNFNKRKNIKNNIQRYANLNHLVKNNNIHSKFWLTSEKNNNKNYNSEQSFSNSLLNNKENIHNNYLNNTKKII